MPSIIHLLSQPLSNFLDRINWISHFDRSFEHPLLPRGYIYIYEARAARGQGSPPVRSSSATATLRDIPLCTYPVALLRDSLIARRVRADANHSPRPAKVTLSARKIKESRGATLAASLAYSLALSRATYGPLVISLRRD